MPPKLIFDLIILMLIIRISLSDLPSCIRAKCVHCKVYFISQMCPNACSDCPTHQPKTQQNIQQHFLTAFKPVINNDEEEINRAFSHGTVIVPIAQQIPTNFNRNIQQPINNLQKQTTKQKIQRNRNQQHGTVQRNQKIQYQQQQPQYTFVQQPQNYIGGGGFYGGEPNIQKQQYPIPRPPPTIFQPLEIQKEQQFNQFQPFMQQSYQPTQQFQQTISTISSSNGQLPSIQIPNNQPNPITQTLQQKPSIFPQNPNNQPIMNIDKPYILNSVPNVDQSQNFQKLYNFPQQQQINGKIENGWSGEKSHLSINKESNTEIIGNSIFTGGESEEKCPKPNWEPCVPKDVANRRFLNCCSQLGEGCSQLCSYDQNLTNIQVAVLTGRCPINKVADMMLCASGYEDATPCCKEFNVFETGFEHCRPYCNPAGGLPNDGMLVEKYKCLQKLQQIQRCFYLSQRP